MTKFVYAICDAEELTNTLKTVMAKDHAEAKDKIISRLLNNFPDLDSDDWEEVLTKLAEMNLYVGEPQDIDTL